MIQGQLTALDSQEHKTLKFSSDVNYDFTRKVGMVPVVVGELPLLCETYPVVFAKIGTSDEYSLVAVLSFMEDTNSYLDKDGNWLAEYVPSYVRKYPFITANVEGAKDNKKVLCFDPEAPHFKQDKGDPLFDKDGKPSDTVDVSLRLNEEFESSLEQSKEFCAEMAKSNVLAERQENSPYGNLLFYTLKLEALSTLSVSKIKEWHENGYLNIVMSIIQSNRGWREVQARMDFSSKEKTSKAK